MKRYSDLIALVALLFFVALLTVCLSTGLSQKNFYYMFAMAAICISRFIQDRKQEDKTPEAQLPKRGALYKIGVTLFFVLTLPILFLMIYSSFVPIKPIHPQAHIDAVHDQK